MPYVYFIESGVASIVVSSEQGQLAEGGVVGREGFVAPAAALGADRFPHKIEMQIVGTACRISRTTLLDAAAESRKLSETLLHFANVMAVQSAYTSLSNAVQRVGERLARWLLMCADRGDSAEIALTHRFMSVMLAVRRSSVTNALHEIEGRKLITSGRGIVTIVDRTGLEALAGGTYGKPEAEYRRLLGEM